MKKVALIVALMLVSTLAYAESTGTTLWHKHSIPDEAFDLGPDTQRQDFGYGVGADVVVFQSSNPLFESVEVQGRYDIELRETRVFGVVKVNLWEALGGK